MKHPVRRFFIHILRMWVVWWCIAFVLGVGLFWHELGADPRQFVAPLWVILSLLATFAASFIVALAVMLEAVKLAAQAVKDTFGRYNRQ